MVIFKNYAHMCTYPCLSDSWHIQEMACSDLLNILVNMKFS